MPRMRKALAVGSIAAATFFVPANAALAAGEASSGASCVAVITSLEATQLEAGFVGYEVSDFATSGPGFGAHLVGPLAQLHLGSLGECRAAEG